MKSSPAASCSVTPRRGRVAGNHHSNRMWQTTFSKNIHSFDSGPCHQLGSGRLVPNEADRWMWIHRGAAPSGKSETFSFCTWSWSCPARLSQRFLRPVGCRLFWHNSWLSHEGLITYLVQKCCRLTADGIAVNSFYMSGIRNYTRRCLHSVFLFREGLF